MLCKFRLQQSYVAMHLSSVIAEIPQFVMKTLIVTMATAVYHVTSTCGQVKT